jgi:hypothetical protein
MLCSFKSFILVVVDGSKKKLLSDLVSNIHSLKTVSTSPATVGVVNVQSVMVVGRSLYTMTD